MTTIARVGNLWMPLFSSGPESGGLSEYGMPVLFAATSNLHKADEIRTIIADRAVLLTTRDTEVRLEIEETGSTFQENALLKAVTWAAFLAADECHMTAEWVLADDSGLEVDALRGAPGVHSARFAALDTGAPGNSPDAENNAKLLRLLGDLPAEQRTARFRCVLALVPILRGGSAGSMAAQARYFEGSCEGRMGFTPQGGSGFGYDPLFFPDGFNQSFAELGPDIKNRISHRSQALARLRPFWAALPALNNSSS